MNIEYNGEVITKNLIIGSLIMALAVFFFPLVPITMFGIVGETMAYFFPNWFESGIYVSGFSEMWIGGVITLVGVMLVFGRKGSGLSINNDAEAVDCVK